MQDVTESSRTNFLWPPSRRSGGAVAVLFTAFVAAVNWFLVPNLSLGLLYFFPILIVAAYWNVWEMAILALACTILREIFVPAPWSARLIPWFVTDFFCYAGVGFLAREMQRQRAKTSKLNRELGAEIDRQKSTEEQLRGLLEGSPAAILSADADGKILLANSAAHEVLGFLDQSLVGHAVDEYVPELAHIGMVSRARKPVRTLIECTGYRRGGEPFQANVWLSSFGEPPASLVVTIFDTSEQLRDAEEMGLHTLARGARVLMSAFWHEVRNVCAAMRMVSAKLKELPQVAESDHMETMQILISSLEKLSAAGLHPDADDISEIASLRVVLDHLRIIIEPELQEADLHIHWELEEHLPLIRAEQHGLLQVFLNLARNAIRALKQSQNRQLIVSTTTEKQRMIVRFFNAGMHLAHPELLFQPFRPLADDSGLGLYISRALVRSFGGDLRYEARPDGNCFAVHLEISSFGL